MTTTIRKPLLTGALQFRLEIRLLAFTLAKIGHLGKVSLWAEPAMHLDCQSSGGQAKCPPYLVWKPTRCLFNFSPGGDGLATPWSIEEQQHHLRIPANVLCVVQLPLEEVKNRRPRGEKADRWLCWNYHIFCSTKKRAKTDCLVYLLLTIALCRKRTKAKRKIFS